MTYDIAITGNPLNVPALSNSPVDLILTGGTYGTGYNDSKYNKGMYDENGTKILVNGGVGGHAGVTRIFNFPEIECVTFSDGSIADTNPLKDFLNGLMDTNESIDMDDKYQVYKQQKKSETVEE